MLPNVKTLYLYVFLYPQGPLHCSAYQPSLINFSFPNFPGAFTTVLGLPWSSIGLMGMYSSNWDSGGDGFPF